MSAIRTAATMIGVAMTVARHPMVRAAVRAAPKLVTPKMRATATDATLDAAYRAGVLARKIVKRR
jgi:hypothetical protein